MRLLIKYSSTVLRIKEENVLFSEAFVFTSVISVVRIVCCLILLAVILGLKPIRKSKKLFAIVGTTGLVLIAAMVVLTHMADRRVVADEEDEFDQEQLDALFAGADEYDPDTDYGIDEYSGEFNDELFLNDWYENGDAGDSEYDPSSYADNYDRFLDNGDSAAYDYSDADTYETEENDDYVDDSSYSGDSDYSFPDMNGNSYMSNVLGISYTIDSDWTYADEARLATHDGVSTNYFQNAMYADIMGGTNYRSEMFAESNDGYKTVGVTVLYIGNVNPDKKLTELIEASGLTDEKRVLKSYGGDSVNMTNEDGRFCGKKAKIYHLIVGYSNDAILYSDVAIFANNGFVGVVTANSVNEEASDLFESFQAVGNL